MRWKGASQRRGRRGVSVAVQTVLVVYGGGLIVHKGACVRVCVV